MVSKQYLAPLPKSDEDWEKLHYCLYLQTAHEVLLVGLGDSISECKTNALSNLFNAKMPIPRLQKITKYVALTNLNDGISYELKANQFQKFNISLCEARVFIYAKRYGQYGMRLTFDTSLNQPLARFAGYDEDRTNSHFLKHF